MLSKTRSQIFEMNWLNQFTRSILNASLIRQSEPVLALNSLTQWSSCSFLTTHYRGRLSVKNNFTLVCPSHSAVWLEFDSYEPLLWCFLWCLFESWKLQSSFNVIARKKVRGTSFIQEGHDVMMTYVICPFKKVKIQYILIQLSL